MRSLYCLTLLALVGCSSTPDKPDGAVNDAGSVLRDDLGTDLGTDLGSDAGAVVDHGGPVPCTAGRIESCPCASGGAGAQTCGTDGVYGPCVCLTMDAGTLDATIADALALDATATDVTPLDVTAADVRVDSSVAATGIAGDEYCRAAGVGTVCSAGATNTCGVCVTPGIAVMERTNCDDTQRRESCQSGTIGAPDLRCYAPANRPVAGVSQAATMWGYVRVYGDGGDSQHVRVSVYRVNVDGTPGDLVGTTVSDITAPGAGTEDVYSPSRDRVLFTRNTGGYQIANVPTETELLVVTEGDAADATSAGLWSHRVYSYDVVLLNADVGSVAAPAGVTGTRTVRYLPLVLSNSDWGALPATSTFTAGITAGRAMVLGEVHDCGDVRLANATVESSPRRAWDGPVVYFSENDTNPLPDLSRSVRGTSLLGTYMLLDVDPGPLHVAALGRDASSTLVHVGSRRVRAFPNAVTWVTLRGLRPWQVSATGTDAGATP